MPPLSQGFPGSLLDGHRSWEPRSRECCRLAAEATWIHVCPSDVGSRKGPSAASICVHFCTFHFRNNRHLQPRFLRTLFIEFIHFGLCFT